MASHSFLSSLILITLLACFPTEVRYSKAASISTADMYAFCSDKIPRCSSSLYYTSNNLTKEDIAYHYSVNPSQISTFLHQDKQDYLIRVPCSCQSAGGTTGYFYNTTYIVRQDDSFFTVSSKFYNGQAYQVGNEEETFILNATVQIYLMCGCVKNDDQLVVTYTVHELDTLLGIGNMLSALLSGIESLSRILRYSKDQNFILPGWVLFVPMELKGLPSPKKGKRNLLSPLLRLLHHINVQ